MISSRRSLLIGLLLSFLSGVCSAFIWYCEKLQFLPKSAIGFYGRIGIVFTAGMIVCLLIYFLICNAVSGLTFRDWLPIILAALVLSVCMMIWFPVPRTGLFSRHTLEIRALQDEHGSFRPVTLSWLHIDSGDVSLTSIWCEGNCVMEPLGPTLYDADAYLAWHGKTGGTATVEFVSDQGQ